MALIQVNALQTVEGGIEALTELLAGAIGTAGKMHLYQSSFSPTPSSVEADFTAAEATFTGYAAATVSWGAIGLDSVGLPTTISDRALFQATDAVTPNVIGGVWYECQTAAGPPAVHKSINYFAFPNPISMATALATIGVVLNMVSPGIVATAAVDY